MLFKKMRWYSAALVAFIMGIPMAEKASAANADVGSIVDAAIALALSIIDVAGNS